MARELLKYRTGGVLESPENFMSLDKLSTLSEKFIESWQLYFEEGSKESDMLCGFVYCRWNTVPKQSQVYG